MTQIIADACSNHLGDRRIIDYMIKTAAEVGIDYIKFQAFTADKLNKNWYDYKKAYEYYKSIELSKDDYSFILCKCTDIKPLFTVFDIDKAKYLTGMVDTIKIASPDADNEVLVDYCKNYFKRVIISTGMTTPKRNKELRKYNTISLLYCISKYPTHESEVDFDKMQMFDGFSDHTQGIEASKKAIELELDYIERHYTLGKYLPGNDHFLSSTPDEFKELVNHRNYIQKCKLYKERWNG